MELGRKLESLEQKSIKMVMKEVITPNIKKLRLKRKLISGSLFFMFFMFTVYACSYG
jgi:hypothetical protein